jgi:hypothetical protein
LDRPCDVGKPAKLENRHGRFRDGDTLSFVFEQALARCVREGLVGGEGFAIDASLVKADANRQRGVPGAEADRPDRQSISRPVREYLAALDQAEVEKNTPKNISLTDPGARWSAARGPAFYSKSANYLIDIAAGIVVAAAAELRPPSALIDAPSSMTGLASMMPCRAPKRRARQDSGGPCLADLGSSPCGR